MQFHSGARARFAHRLAGALRRVAAVGLGCAALSAAAADYPTRAVTIIVPFPAGGGGDITTRQIAERLRLKLGQPIVIENRAGASGNIGFQAGARAAPDGYTLTALFAPLTINPFLMKGPVVDPLKDFAPVAAISSYYLTVVVHQSARAKTLAELIAAAKAAPGTVGYASLGGSVLLSQLMLEHAAGIKFLTVPYKGTADQLRAVLGGEVVASGIPLKAVLPHIKDGRLRAVGYYGPKRPVQLPDVPAIVEVVPGAVPVGSWTGLGAPAATPPEIVATVSRAVKEVLQDPAFRDKLAEAGDDALSGMPEELTQMIRRELQLYGDLTRKAGIVRQ